jgi:hypothetical protein
VRKIQTIQELDEAGEAWVEGTYLKSSINTKEDLQRAVRAGKTFWFPSDGKWGRNYAFLIFLIAISLLPFTVAVILFCWSSCFFCAIVIASCVVGAFCYRERYCGDFLEIGPNGVIFRKTGNTTAFRWDELSRVKPVDIKPNYEEGGINSWITDGTFDWTLPSGQIINFDKILRNLNQDEVKSVCTFRNLFLAYWNRMGRTVFRGTEITGAEAEVLRQLEQVACLTFETVENLQSNTPMGFTAIGGHVTGVSMCHCVLRPLPESIGQLTSLLTLYLRNNQLTALPETIGQLSLLAELDLQGNPITSLPASITRLATLRWLSLDEGVNQSLSGDVKMWVIDLQKRERLRLAKQRTPFVVGASKTDQSLRVTTACDDEVGCTGFLTKIDAVIRRELVRRGAVEFEDQVVELICEQCGATLPRAPAVGVDVPCPECKRVWKVTDVMH